jgi:propionyl-CoA carboxylase alpha chain
LSATEEAHLAAVATALAARQYARGFQIQSATSQGFETFEDPHTQALHFTVELPQAEGSNHLLETTAVLETDKKAKVSFDGHSLRVQGNMNLAQAVLNLSVDDQLGSKPFVAQIFNRSPGWMTLIYKGTQFKIKVLPKLASQYMKYMPEKVPLDLTAVTLSPMAGMIKSVNIEIGQMVGEGQELCVIEAMKMQNSLLAGKTGKVKTVNCVAGETVGEGDVLVELE